MFNPSFNPCELSELCFISTLSLYASFCSSGIYCPLVKDKLSLPLAASLKWVTPVLLCRDRDDHSQQEKLYHGLDCLSSSLAARTLQWSNVQINLGIGVTGRRRRPALERLEFGQEWSEQTVYTHALCFLPLTSLTFFTPAHLERMPPR